MSDRYRIEDGSHFKISDSTPDDTGEFASREEAEARTAEDIKELAVLHERLYVDRRFSLLIVLQGMDTGGKDGTIKHVFSGVNPQGCQVTSFKKPSEDEQAHDYLWRIAKALPARGDIGIFNRSHYEDVLIVRVHDLVPKKIWSQRFEQINDFERRLSDEGTVILKFFLHISKDEQKKRLLARIDDPEKRWKFTEDDVHERRRWKDYLSAYEDVIRKCSTPHAPWYVVPADHKWFRNYVVANAIVKELKKLDLQLPKIKLDKNVRKQL